MNILYLHAHDLGRYCQPYGHPIPSPHVQKLAERGVLFRQAFCAAPSCSPSRSALLSGRYPHCNGMFGLTFQGWTLHDYRWHLSNVLAGHGYHCALSGIQHEAPHRDGNTDMSALGYHERLGGKGVSASEAAAEFLGRQHDKPFFLSVGINEPHRHNPGDRWTFSSRYPTEPEGVDTRYVTPFPHQPDHPVTRREMANFKMGVAVMDEHFGRVLDALEAGGHAQNTLVICTTDHGPGVSDMKCTLQERGTGVTLILAGPGPFGGGRVSDALVSHVDVFPTLCDALALPTPDWLQGVSLMPLLRGDAEQVRDVIFTEQHYHGSFRPKRAVRNDRYKLIRSYPGAEGAWGVDRGPVHELLEEAGMGSKPDPYERLHDLLLDPHEANNLIASPDHALIAAELARRLDTWQRETEDPALEAAIPAPPQR